MCRVQRAEDLRPPASGSCPRRTPPRGLRYARRGRCRAGHSPGRGSGRRSRAPNLSGGRVSRVRPAAPVSWPMPGVPPARYAYLGPEGTFTEQALRTLPAAARGRAAALLHRHARARRGARRRGRRRGRPDRELRRGLGAGHPRRARDGRAADDHPRDDRADRFQPACPARHAGPRTYDGSRPTRTRPRRPVAGCALHLPDADVVHTTSTAQAAFMLTRDGRRAGTPRSPHRSPPSTTGSRAGQRHRRQPRRADPLRAGVAARARRRRRPAGTRPRWSRSCGRTTRAR